MKKVFSIGRDSSCDIVLYDPSNVVSRSHATLRVDGKKYFITDHSTNGTYRNGIKLTPNVEYRITRDDDVYFGEAVRLDWNSVPGASRSSQSFWPYLLVFLLSGALVACAFWLVPKICHSHDGQQPEYTVPVDTTVAPQQPVDSLAVTEQEAEKAEPEVKEKPKAKPKAQPKEKKESASIMKKVVDKYTDEDDKETHDAL